MAEPRGYSISGKLVVAVLLGSTGLAAALLFFVRAWYSHELQTTSAPTTLPPSARAVALLTTLGITLISAIAFLAGAMAIRMSRAAVGAEQQRKPTQYVDAWANYRVTDEQIADATREPSEGEEGKPR